MTTLRGAAFGVRARHFRSSSATPKAMPATVVAGDHQPQEDAARRAIFWVEHQLRAAKQGGCQAIAEIAHGSRAKTEFEFKLGFLRCQGSRHARRAGEQPIRL